MPPFDPREFCKAAHWISNVDKALEGEAAWRTAAGRAYYAAWLATRDAIRVKQRDLNHDPGHRPLWKELQKEGHPEEVKLLGQQGAQLFRLRELADYEPSQLITRADAQKMAKLCHEYLRDLVTVSRILPFIPHHDPRKTAT